MPTYNIAGVPIEFPFEAYELQLLYMEKVVLALERSEHALLESPTGTGKTLCLLCATLGWRQHQIDKARVYGMQGSQLGHGPQMPDPRKLPRIVYTSRTHSQLKQVVKQLRMTSYRPVVSVIGSREQMCIHPEASKKHGVDQVACCQALVAAKRCRPHNELQRRKGPTKTGTVPHPDLDKPNGCRTMPDIEDFVAIAEGEGLCPFHWARDIQHTAEVLLLPYNFLADATTRRALGLNVGDDVVIFDEAHNVEKVFAEAASFELNALDFAGAAREIEFTMRRAEDSEMPADGEGGAAAENGEGGAAAGAGEWLQLKSTLLDLEARVAELPLVAPGRGGEPRYTADGHAMKQLLALVNITAETLEPLLAMMSNAIKALSDAARWGAGGSAHYLRKMSDCLRVVFNEDLDPSEFRVCVTEDTEQGAGGGPAGRRRTPLLGEPLARTLGYVCQNPGVGMRALVRRGVRSVLLTSGTLSPLSSFALELGIPFAHQLENPHIVSAKQIMVGVLPKGPSGVELTSSYVHRESEAYKCELGNTLANVARLVPQGVLVFFPSYAALKGAYARWGQPSLDGKQTVLQRLEKHKHVVVEPRSAAEVAVAVDAFRHHVALSERTGVGGAILLAVCRGRLSEGVDFSDAACRAVVVTGLPLPPAYDAKVQLKREFLDGCIAAAGAAGRAGRLTGEEWYDQQALRAINQAVGRVIRHVADYGAVLLCESRFRRPKYVAGLSLWLRPHIRQFEQFGQASVALPRFFRNAATEDEARQVARAAAAPPPAPVPHTASRSTVEDCAERPRAPAAPPAAAPAPSLLKVLEAARGAIQNAPRDRVKDVARDAPRDGVKDGARLPATAAPTQGAHEAALPPPSRLAVVLAGGAPGNRPHAGPVATARPGSGHQGATGASATAAGLPGPPRPRPPAVPFLAEPPPAAGSEGSAAPKAKELLSMAQGVMPKHEYDGYIRMLRSLRELRRGDADAAAGGIAPIKSQAAALFAGGKYKEVAAKTMRFLPAEFREDLHAAFVPPPPPTIESSIGALQARLKRRHATATEESGIHCAKGFMQAAQGAFVDSAAFAEFKVEMRAHLLELKAAGASEGTKRPTGTPGAPAASACGVREVLRRISELFQRRGLGGQLRDEFARFIPAEHAAQWADIADVEESAAPAPHRESECECASN